MSPVASRLPGGIPQRIGPYRVLSVLGEGGMGVVCLAEQTEPVVREVALKILKPEKTASDQFLARFEAERQALALMEHDSIARIYEAGTTAEGLAYFAMELIRGIPITTFCDENRLPIPARLELFTEVCRALQHAHQKGIIHRDLKPSNILVAEGDKGPVPKLIDFGIAKAMDLRLSERTLETRTGVVIGTPAYMSPEQWESSKLDIDTRADIYSLGMLLYELLVGRLPFELEDLRGLAALYTLSSRPLPTPVARFGSLELSAREMIAAGRQTEAAVLTRRLAGDLSWITMKALEPDRSRRYQTANELAADIGRYLGHEPVSARAPSMAYRGRKFARRHRGGVAAAVVVTVGLVTGAVLATVGLVRATRAEARAATDAVTAEQVTDVMVDLFQVSNPGEALGNTITAREVMDDGVERIQTNLADQPLIRARLLQTIGRVYFNLGLYEQSESLLKDALDIKVGLHGSQSAQAAEGLTDLAQVYWKTSDYPRAESLLVRATAVGEQVPDPDLQGLARSQHVLGIIHSIQGRSEKAEEAFLRALEVRERAEPPDLQGMGKTLNSLGIVYMERGQYDRAIEYFDRTLEVKRQIYGPEHPSNALTLYNLGILHLKQRQYPQAESSLRTALEINQKVYGEDHVEVADVLDEIGGLKAEQGLYDEAEEMHLRAFEIRLAQLEPGHSDFYFSHNSLANLYRRRGEHEKALPHFDQANENGVANFGADHAAVGQNLGGKAVSLRELARYPEAEAAFLRAIELLAASLEPDDPELLAVRGEYTELLRLMERYDEAAAEVLQAVEALEASLEPDNPQLVAARESHAELLRLAGRDLAENKAGHSRP